MKYLIILASLDLLLLALIFFSVLFIRLPTLLLFLNKRFELCRKFILKNETPFNVGFIMLFTVEQGLLIISIFISENINILKVTISLFSLIVIFTASLQATILQTRLRYEKERTSFVKRWIQITKELSERVKKKKDL
ncbi:MAG: hypothetical protein KJ674_00005 [Nanoarchaeota archaeon]|nr:hypothetical protein [Nanoarchaeota archaeon]